MHLMQDSPVGYPLLARGKGCDLYDPGEHLLTTVTDRFSSFKGVLLELIFSEGELLNTSSTFFFEQPSHSSYLPLGSNNPTKYLIPITHNDQAFNNGS